jgi:hypothetical protein
MQMCNEVHKQSKKIIFIIFKNLWNFFKNNLKLLVIPKLTRNKIKEITFGFENLYGSLYIFAIDGSHDYYT